ncbi:sulfate ABC transporter substrate-binding protein [Rhizobium rosettiformans]|uniref:sulfate ABC transporter substrate-binding protein n=1 Tax=Rhizobium rosettiformans TaxID=1368430 RepID=UPI0028556270|nr:sulfate ABC transporter substrate-binding protein [Rhizobium rosettiformans]MDR7026662.1 sulfate transport system substrate-binding protein [Rhizobium rosettiformans]MDR7064783.1 sulfate transport system substrate-binding protein [Rhizobium rosettiformans]
MTCIGKNLAAFLVGLSLSTGLVLPAGAAELLNVSYDPTREFYQDYNAAFAKHWQQETGETVTIDQSHGGSGRQARAVMEGLEADVVTLALQSDIDIIAERAKLLAPDWRNRLPNNSSPYTSTIVFLVRKGNPKGIQDWGDLVKGDVQIVTPNPKTSGGARWNYLAAWAWANKQFGGDQQKIRDYIAEIYRHAPVLDTGARGALTSFAQREIGDVLISWENEAYLAGKEFGADQFDIVTPSLSILAEPPVAVVDVNVEKKGTRKEAEAYLDYLYSAEGQTLAAKHFYRPSRPDLVPAGSGPELPKLDLVTIDDPLFGGWAKAQAEHFGEGGVFDQIYRP